MNAILLAFARPLWLLALLPLAWLAWRLWRAPLEAVAAWQRVVDAHLLPPLLTDAGPDARRVATMIFAAGMALAVLALSGPTFDNREEQAARRNVLRVLVIDLSPQAAPHLPRIKAKADALLRALPEGETALLVYAEEPYLVVPPTTDSQTIARFIPELAVDAVPAPGHRPERALAMAGTLFERGGSALAREIVWITAEADPAVLAAARPQGARVSVLHAGSRDRASLTIETGNTGGMALQMRDDDSDARMLAAAMTQDGQWTSHAQRSTGHADAGYWLLPLLLPLAALAFRRGVLMLLAPLVCASLLMPPDAQASGLSDYLASRLLAHGKPEAAAARFSDPQWRAVAAYRAGRYEDAAQALEGRNEPDALYNRGNALAKQGRLTDALAAYEASLQSRPGDADTVHNRDLVKRLLNQRNKGGGGGGGNTQDQETQKQRDAGRVAEQWLNGVPDEPQTLLRRKLALEHQLRQNSKTERPW